MTTKNNARPDEGTSAENNRLATCSQDTADTRPRCGRCHHPLEAYRSVSRGFGPVCWLKTELGALDLERDRVGHQLDTLARQAGQLDLAQLDHVSVALSYAQAVTQ